MPKRRPNRFKKRTAPKFTAIGIRARIVKEVGGKVCPCHKILYPSKSMANQARKWLEKTSDRPEPIHVYACPRLVGQGWHVGHNRYATTNARG